jgi:hypothetical protein
MANFWEKVTGFVGNLAKVSEATEGLTGSLADNAENVARGQSAIWDARQDRDERDLAMQLQRLKVQRGDNVQLYWAMAVGAAFGLILLTGK